MIFVPDIDEFESDPYIIGRRYGRLFKSAEWYLREHLQHTESDAFEYAVGESTRAEKYCWAVMHAKRSAMAECEQQKLEYFRTAPIMERLAILQNDKRVRRNNR